MNKYFFVFILLFFVVCSSVHASKQKLVIAHRGASGYLPEHTLGAAVMAYASGADFRADANNALAAIVSNNSNSSSPSTTYAYQWWADTSAGVMKIRNSANDGWIELFQLDGTLTLEDGSASSPALSFRDDLNTGIFSSAADHIEISAGGVARVSFGTAGVAFNDDGNDYDFRIEGDTEQNLFFIDAANDRVGIGNATPVDMLNITVTTDGEGITLSAGNVKPMFVAVSYTHLTLPTIYSV